MLSNEIKYQQSQYRECVSDFTKANIHTNKRFLESLQKKCKDSGEGVSQLYTPYFERSVYNSKYFTSIFYDKINEAYNNLGKYGYNHHLCESL